MITLPTTAGGLERCRLCRTDRGAEGGGKPGNPDDDKSASRDWRHA